MKYLTAIAVCLAVAFAACGGGDGETVPTETISTAAPTQAATETQSPSLTPSSTPALDACHLIPLAELSRVIGLEYPPGNSEFNQNFRFSNAASVCTFLPSNAPPGSPGGTGQVIVVLQVVGSPDEASELIQQTASSQAGQVGIAPVEGLGDEAYDLLTQDVPLTTWVRKGAAVFSITGAGDRRQLVEAALAGLP